MSKTINIKPGVFFHERTFADDLMPCVIRVVMNESPEAYVPTITSGADGVHSPNSRHPLGLALDFRTRDFPSSVQLWARRIQNVLGDYYYVLNEQTHLHINYRGPRK